LLEDFAAACTTTVVWGATTAATRLARITVATAAALPTVVVTLDATTLGAGVPAGRAMAFALTNAVFSDAAPLRMGIVKTDERKVR